jgi:hypothetical protein
MSNWTAEKQERREAAEGKLIDWCTRAIQLATEADYAPRGARIFPLIDQARENVARARTSRDRDGVADPHNMIGKTSALINRVESDYCVARQHGAL